MEVKFIEATDATQFNWGKFMLCRFTPVEWNVRSAIGENASLVRGQGWSSYHILVVDLATGEGAFFRPGGRAVSDLNDKHQIWVCPMFEPFLVWLYQQDILTRKLATLPALVNLGAVPTAMSGYRRKRKENQ